MSQGIKAAGVAWLITAVYYFYQYTLRSAPAVMMPQLSQAFGLTSMGVASMVGLFYWGYSPFSLVAGAAIDRLGPRKVVPLGAAAVGIGALLFATGNKQLGIIGRGRIGRAVAARAPAFGMTAVFAKHDMSLDELLVSSDVISIHAPSTPATRHLIDRKALARMKRSAILVNTARGTLVDEEALVWALGEHLIAGAALDVYEKEPIVHPGLLTLEHVVLAPHLGSATRETRTAMADLAVANVLAVLDGRPPVTPV